MRRRELLYEENGHDYSKDYLTFTANSACQVKFTGKTPDGEVLNQLQYSINGGTWNTLPDDTYVSLASGNSIMFKGNCIPFSDDEGFDDEFGIGSFASTEGTFNVSGNIMSLLFGDNFERQTDLTGYDYAFANLFNGCTGIVSIENLILPATTLASYCYYMMFEGCSSLTSIPSDLLPATTLANYCYSSMFINCTGLTSVPALPATTLADYCYYYMFGSCSSLTSIPSTLLPATTLAQYCYNGMFYNCSSLTTAPDLPATSLANGCYEYMLSNCSSLNYIKAMFTTTPSTSYTNSWVSGVASTGTFVKNSVATWDVTGVNGIPSGWTVQTASS